MHAPAENAEGSSGVPSADVESKWSTSPAKRLTSPPNVDMRRPATTIARSRATMTTVRPSRRRRRSEGWRVTQDALVPVQSVRASRTSIQSTTKAAGTGLQHVRLRSESLHLGHTCRQYRRSPRQRHRQSHGPGTDAAAAAVADSGDHLHEPGDVTFQSTEGGRKDLGDPYRA